MNERYLKYLPQIIENMEEFQVLALAEGGIIKEIEQATRQMEQEQWIQTSTMRGLERREKMMGISKREGESLEEKRKRILYLWNHHGPYTYGTLLLWLDGFCGAGNYVISLNYNIYMLQVVLNLSVKQLQNEILKNMRKVIPSNLVLVVLVDYNTYLKLKPLTHINLKNFFVQYGAIKEVDFFKERLV